MPKRKRKLLQFPRATFESVGPKLTARRISEIAGLMELPPGYERFLMWRNGGRPRKCYFDWTHPRDGAVTSRLDQLLEVNPDARGTMDCIDCILRFRNWLPRWSIPIGSVDEDSFLLTFHWGDPRIDEVWLKRWYHEDPDASGPEEDVYHIADSIPEFLAMLHDRAPEYDDD